MGVMNLITDDHIRDFGLQQNRKLIEYIEFLRSESPAKILRYSFTISYPNTLIDSVPDFIFYNQSRRFSSAKYINEFNRAGDYVRRKTYEFFKKISQELGGHNHKRLTKIKQNPLVFFSIDKAKQEKRESIQSQYIHPLHVHGVCYLRKIIANEDQESKFKNLISSAKFKKGCGAVDYQFDIETNQDIIGYWNYSSKSLDVPVIFYSRYPANLEFHFDKAINEFFNLRKSETYSEWRVRRLTNKGEVLNEEF
jgi:hypothetical protein